MCPDTNPVMSEVVPVEGLPETQVVEQPAEEQPTPKKKTFATRFAGLLLIVASVLPLFLNVNYVVGSTVKSATLLAVLGELFASQETLLGVLPVLANNVLASVGLYAFILGVVLGALFGLFTLLFGKKGTLRVGSFFLATAASTYVFTVYLASNAFLDVIVLASFVIAALLYVILSFKARGKRAFGAIVNVLTSVVVAFALAVCLVRNMDTFTAGLTKVNLSAMESLVRWVVLGVALLSGFYATIRMQTEKGRGLDLFRVIVMFVLSGVVLALGFMAGDNNQNYILFAGVATGVSFLQIVVLASRIKKIKKALKVVEEVVEETVEEVVEEVVEAVEEEFIREEFAEATPYEGGPVEGVVTAEEVVPTFTEKDPLPEVRTAGYDFYNCKSFDPFIAILNTEERNQFTELFILKYKGVMPEIPDYEVGGNNKEFFRKLFIYLGQYRDRIPDALLAKIYQFAIKLQ